MSIAQHRRYRHRLLKRIAMRSALGDESEINAAQIAREKERYLKSHAVQSAVRYEMNCREHGVEEANTRWRAAQATPVVPFDYRRTRDRPILYHHKPRATSGLRKICSLPEITKMWHILARDLVVAQHRSRPHIGDWKGRGREWQMGQLLPTLRSPDITIVCADIRHAFASVRPDALYQLPFLPEPLIRRMIDCRYQQFVRRERSEYAVDTSLATHDVLELVPSGLMEGSPASNAIFSVLLDDLPDHVGEDIGLFVYCDNIIMVAPTIRREQEAEDALVRYLTGHWAGPFEARISHGSLRQSFNHLGYRMAWNDTDGLKVGLTTANWRRFAERLDDPEVAMEDTIKRRLASFGHCTANEWLRSIAH